MTELLTFDSSSPTPPGVIIEEVMETYSLSNRDLAKMLGLKTKEIRKLIEGKTPMTLETASKLETAIGTPSRLLLAMEEEYKKK